MMLMQRLVLVAACVIASGPAVANAYREKGKPATVADSMLIVTPPRDWNRLTLKPGKKAETWTLDGEQLNEVTFYAGIEPGQPLIRERNRKRAPLPKFSASTLLVEIPELLSQTYRADKGISRFVVTSTQPDHFLQSAGVRFLYEYTDADDLPRKGEAIAAVVGGKLYMVKFDAPRLHYFDRTAAEYRALVQTASLAR